MSDVITVSSAEELMDALEAADGGETIMLEGGDYGELNLNSVKSGGSFVFSETVTIKSADGAEPAVFSGVDLYEVEGISFEDVTMDYTFAPDHVRYESPFTVTNSSNVTFDNVVFDGDIAEGISEEYDGYGYSYALSIRDSEGVTVDSSTFYDFHRGILVGGSQDVTLTGNDISQMSSDGINVAETSNILIEGNYIHDFDKPEASGAHMDMIQFWTAGTDEPSTDIVIRGNILDSGEGSETQTIFMRNEEVDRGNFGEEMFYQNVVIEDNLIYNAHTHGVTVGETDGLLIQNNTIIHNSDAADVGLVSVPTITVNENSLDVTVQNNIVPRLDVPENSELEFHNNVVIQNLDPNSPNYYGDIFMDGLAGAQAAIDDLQLRPDSGLDGVGAQISQFAVPDDGVSGYVDVGFGTGLMSMDAEFELSAFVGPNKGYELSDASVSWHFGEGEAQEGWSAAHQFTEGGRHVVTVEVSWPDGTVDIIEKTVMVKSPVALDMMIGQDIRDYSEIENAITLSDGVSIEEQDGVSGAQLNGGTITVETTDDFFRNEEYTFSLDFAREPNSGSARLVNFTNNIVIFVDDDQFTVYTTFGETGYKVTEKVSGLNTGEWQNISLTYSNSDSSLKLFHNGQLIAELNDIPDGVQGLDGTRDLIIGDPYGSKNFEGLIGDAVFLTGALSPEAVMELALNDVKPDLMTIEQTEEEVPVSPEEEAPASTGEVDPEEIPEVDGDDGAAEEETPPDTVSPEAAPATEPEPAPETEGSIDRETVFGSSDDDYFKLNEASEVHAGLGNDIVNAGDGDDTLFGDDGNDALVGGDGNDLLDGGLGADVLMGGNGDDILVFDQNDVRIQGDEGFDTLKVTSATADLFAMLVYGVDLVDAEDGSDTTIFLHHKRIDQADNGVLQVKGDKGDTVVLEESFSTRIIDDEIEIDGELYLAVESTRYGDTSTVYIDADMTILSDNDVIYDPILADQML